MSGPDPTDLTLDEIRERLGPIIAAGAAFDGWTELAVRQAAQQADIDPDVAAYAFKGGQMDMIAAWIAHVDSLMAGAFSTEQLAQLKIRERILQLVRFRLEAISDQDESVRRALAILAMPHNLARSARLGWHSADQMWRLAGDTSTDYNYYSKRMILAGIYSATLAVFVDDRSPDKSETLAFLGRRIDGVMRFEKAKARWAGSAQGGFSVARFLGRLRYPAS